MLTGGHRLPEAAAPEGDAGIVELAVTRWTVSVRGDGGITDPEGLDAHATPHLLRKDVVVVEGVPPFAQAEVQPRARLGQVIVQPLEQAAAGEEVRSECPFADVRARMQGKEVKRVLVFSRINGMTDVSRSRTEDAGAM